jgi:dipeptidase E
MAHSILNSLEAQEGYFKVIENIYNRKYNCECKILRSDKITDEDYVKKLVDWADIIYEGGGNTLDMVALWKETGFDKVLRKAWEDGKVLCGVSAGGCCWFEECSTDSLRIKFGKDQPLIAMDCLGFVKGFFVPHTDEDDRYESVKGILKDKDINGLLLSNCSALEIVDDKYRVITSDATYHNIEPYVLKTYWQDGEYIEEKLDLSSEFKDISELYSRKEKTKIL